MLSLQLLQDAYIAKHAATGRVLTEVAHHNASARVSLRLLLLLLLRF